MPLKDSYAFYLANTAMSPNLDLVVYDKYTGKPATRVAQASASHIEGLVHVDCHLVLLEIHLPCSSRYG